MEYRTAPVLWRQASPQATKMVKQKKRPSQGRRLGRLGGSAGRTAPANFILKRGHAASNNKTGIRSSIFPNRYVLDSRIEGHFCAGKPLARLVLYGQHGLDANTHDGHSRDDLKESHDSGGREYQDSNASLTIRGAHAQCAAITSRVEIQARGHPQQETGR